MKILLYILGITFLIESSLYAQLHNEVFNRSDCGLNFVQQGIKVTTRTDSGDLPGNLMPVTIQIIGMPFDCFEIEAAYVWWIVSYQAGSPEHPTVTISNPSSSTFTYNAVLTGFGDNKCWSEQGTRGFRADVTPAITGNGTYMLSVSTNQWETDGLTLFIVYKDFNAKYQGHLIINDGLITINSSGGLKNSQDTIRNFNACDAANDAKGIMIASDLQRTGVTAQLQFVANGIATTEPRTFWNSNVINTKVQKNQTSSIFELKNNPSNADCYSWLMMGLYYQTTTCTTCPPIINLHAKASKDTVCKGSLFFLSADNAEEYEWTSSPAGFFSQQQYPEDKPDVNTTYYLKGYTHNKCNVNYDTVKVYVWEPPVVNAGDEKRICNGSSVVIGNTATSGKPPYSYEWNPAAGLSDPNIAQPTATPTDTTTYTVTVRDANGCDVKSSVRVIVLPGPIARAGQDIEICYGTSAVIGQPATGGDPPYIYSWSPIVGLSATNIAQPTADPKSTTIYTVTVTDSSGCVRTDNILVTVNALPKANAGTDKDICFGTSTIIGEPATGGTPPYQYKWKPNQFLSNDAIAQPTANPNDTTRYILTVTDAKGCMNYDTVMVNIMPLPQPVIIPEGPTRFCSCDSVVLDGGQGYTSYLWSTNQSSRKISVRNAGSYTVTVTDINGCINTSAPITTSIIYPTSTVALGGNVITAEPGEAVQIPLILKTSENLDSCHSIDFTAQISFNKSLLVPTGTTPHGTITGNQRVIEVNGARIDSNKTLAVLNFIATLGDAEMTPVKLESFVWNDCTFDVATIDSIFALRGICYAGGKARLFKSGSAGYVIANPNPAENTVEIEFGMAESCPIRLSVHDVLGNNIMTIIEGFTEKGRYVKTIDVKQFQTGIYFLILETHSGAFTNILEVK
jgi:hypothetical protein